MAKRLATEPRRLPRQSRSKATVDALIEATAHILVRDGYDKANVNVIAERAGCSIGSLYQYFPTKEALVAAVLRWHQERMIEEFYRGLAELAHRPLAEALRGVLERTFDAMAVNPKLQKVIVEQVPRTGLLVRSRDFEEQLAMMLQGYIEFHRDELRVRNVALAVKVLVHSVDAVATAVVVDDPTLSARREVVDELVALVVGYIAR
jgi:AcrR family transcriptional regulator